MEKSGCSKKSVIRKLRTLSIMPTYQCTAACKHCGTFSSPDVKVSLSETQIIKAIEEVFELGFVNVVFTGGEPMLKWNLLIRGIEYASKKGLLTRIVTNAFWAENVGIAKKRLHKLIDCGLNEINYSTGDQHQRFVPYNRVINAILASSELGLSYHVNIEGTKNSKFRKQHLINHETLIETNLKEIDSRIVESPWMPLSPDAIGNYQSDWYITSKNVASCKGCDSLLQTIGLQADGKITACCGLGVQGIEEFNIGHIDENLPIKNAIDLAESDYLKLIIHYLGAEKLLAWCSNKNQGIKWEGMYAHRCQICMRIYKDKSVRKVLKEHIDELLLDLIASIMFEEAAWPEYMNYESGNISQ